MQRLERSVNDCEIEGRVEGILHVMLPHDLSLVPGGEGRGMATCGSSLEVPNASLWVFPSKFETWRLKGGACVSAEQLRPPGSGSIYILFLWHGFLHCTATGQPLWPGTAAGV